MEYTMQAVVNRNLLKFAVQTAIFCPKCGQILDMRRAVQFSWKEKEMILCAPCFDRWECNLLDCNFTPPAEVLDGRVLFGASVSSCRGHSGWSFPTDGHRLLSGS